MEPDEPPFRGLHGASVFVNLIPQAWRVFRQSWPLLLPLLFGGRTVQGAWLDAAILAFFFLRTVGATVVHWATLRYRVIEGRLEIETGLLQRQVRTIDAERVQNVERMQNVFQRAAGLVEVRVETASGEGVEGLLSALTVADADALITALEASRVPRAAPPPDEVLVENGVLDILRFAIVTRRYGATMVMFGLVMEGMQLLGRDPSRGLSDKLNVAALGFLLLAGGWLFGLVTALVNRYGFRLMRVGHTLVSEEGLLTRRRTEIRADKVQRVAWAVTVPSRWLGFGSVNVETAGLSPAAGGTQLSVGVIPVVGLPHLPEVAGLLVPELNREPALEPISSTAWTAELVAQAIRWTLGIGFAGLVFGWWGLLFLLFAPVSVALNVYDLRNQGWAVSDALVCARRGGWVREVVIVPRRKIQAASADASWFLRLFGLARVHVWVAGSSLRLPLMTQAQAEAVASRLGDAVQAARQPDDRAD
jgi:putative membrane protein